MTSVTLGDLLHVADAHLQDAETARDGIIQPDAVTARDLEALTRALAQYIDHVSPPMNPGDIVAVTGNRARIWEYAAVEMREALHLAVSALNSTQAPREDGDEREPSAIARAAAALASGRDLLGVHFRRNADGETTEMSHWARVITSYPVTRALADEVSGWSQLLAPWVRWIARAPHDHSVGQIPKALADAAHHLEFAGRAAYVARRADPVPEQDRDLLYGIPAAPGQRRPIQPGEPAAALYDGLSETAERLRSIAFHMATYSGWAPGITARAWRHTAMGAAVTSDIAARTLRTLATSETLLDAGLQPDRLTAAADELAQACAAWRDSVTAWNTTTTETRFASSRVITEIDDLVLRIGRVAFTNPNWAPDTPKPVLKEPASTPAAALNVLSAVHQAADALAAMASGDLAAIEVAAQAGRLFVPARALPETMTGRVGRYLPITPDRAETLFQIYRNTIAASQTAASTLATLAAETRAPSRILALARRASCTTSPEPAPPAQQPAQATPRAIPYITEILHTLGSEDPGLFLRAAAIDRAGIEVVNEARRAAGQPPLATSAELRRLADPQHAAKLAAMDTVTDSGVDAEVNRRSQRRRKGQGRTNVQRRAG